MTKYTDHELHMMYDDFLDEVYGTVKIAGLDYETSTALKNADEVAYRCGFSDWLDSEQQADNIFEHSDGEYYDEEEHFDSGVSESE
jgi:hypothetical protein